MKFDDGAEVYVGDAVAVGHHEGVAVNVLLDLLDAPARQRLKSGVGERDVEVLLLVLVVVRDAVLTTEADCEVVVHRLVVQEVLLDHLAAVAEAEHEVSEAVVRVELHDVPEDWTASHLD